LADQAAASSSRWWTTARLRLALGFVLALIVVAGVLAYVFTRPGSGFEMTFGSFGIKLDVPAAVAAPGRLTSFDANDYYVDDELGFAFRRPAMPPWSPPQRLSGETALLRSQNLSGAAINPESVKQSLSSLGPVGRMALDVEAERVTSGSPLAIRELPTSTLEILGKQVPLGAAAVGISFRNSFTVEVYDKRKLAGQKLSLAGFFSLSTNAVGLALDTIKTHDDTLVATETLRYRNVSVDGAKQSFDVLHGFLFAESADRFYEVEIVFSPQTHAPQERLDDLQAMLGSFRVR
jgi:hypothetical protein